MHQKKIRQLTMRILDYYNHYIVPIYKEKYKSKYITEPYQNSPEWKNKIFNYMSQSIGKYNNLIVEYGTFKFIINCCEINEKTIYDMIDILEEFPFHDICSTSETSYITILRNLTKEDHDEICINIISSKKV